MTTVFLDTNVLVSHFMPRGALSAACTAVMMKVEAGEIRAATSASNMLTTMYLMETGGMGQREMTGNLKELLKMVRLVDVSEEHFMQSFSSNFKDKEDGVLYFAAIGDGRIDRFVTHNIKDYKTGRRLSVVTPEQLLKEPEIA